MKQVMSFVFALFTIFPIGAFAQSQPTAQVVAVQAEHIHGGSDIAIRLKLNAPLPEGAHFDLRLSPLAIRQEVSAGSGSP
jgi:hypothetical protein